jgi:hypothetical protein
MNAWNRQTMSVLQIKINTVPLKMIFIVILLWTPIAYAPHLWLVIVNQLFLLRQEFRRFVNKLIHLFVLNFKIISALIKINLYARRIKLKVVLHQIIFIVM